jgi:hypothetical protein
LRKVSGESLAVAMSELSLKLSGILVGEMFWKGLRNGFGFIGLKLESEG